MQITKPALQDPELLTLLEKKTRLSSGPKSSNSIKLSGLAGLETKRIVTQMEAQAEQFIKHETLTKEEVERIIRGSEQAVN